MLIVTQSLQFLTKYCEHFIVYVRFLETLLKDLTNDMKFCVIMKQFWLTFASTKKKSEIISANFFSFFLILQLYFILLPWRVNDLFDNCYKIISDTVLLKIVARKLLSSIISSTILHNYLIYQAL